MKKFLNSIFIFAFIPMLLIIGYFYFDPFKVLYSYDDYSEFSVKPSRDFMTTEKFIKQYKKNRYNSFIFGSSRSLAVRPSSWKRHLGDSARVFSFDASAETIYGIYKKFCFLDSIGVRVDNAVILFDRDCTFKRTINDRSYLYVKHPAISGQSVLDFQMLYFRSYLSPKFMAAYYTNIITNKLYGWMNGIIGKGAILYDSDTNEITLIEPEKDLAKNTEKYYLDRANLFYARDSERIDSVQQIKDIQKSMLIKIQQILSKNNTDYRIILPPLYEQIKFSKQDMSILNNIFDSTRIHDFTGRNSYTESKYNYYENVHFKPAIGDSLLARMYEQNKPAYNDAKIVGNL